MRGQRVAAPLNGHDDVVPSYDPDRQWPSSVLKATAHVLGDTEDGLKGSEIASLLGGLEMADPSPTASKRDRLDAAFHARQDDFGSPRRVATFITQAMQPASYVGRPATFTLRQDRLNEVLTFVGLRLTDKGELAVGAVSATLTEAARHATALLTELERRNTTLRFCATALLSSCRETTSMHASRRARASTCDCAAPQAV